jgi:cystathionine gamma-synthase/methionine-gamma-lyase
MSKKKSIYTLSVQAGYTPPADRAIPAAPPIVPSVGFIHPNMQEAEQALGLIAARPDDPASYVYSRHGGPTQATFEEAIAHLEGAEAAACFSSGMAALYAGVLAVVQPGGVIVAAEQLYGVTRSLLDWLAAHMSVKVHYADFLNLEAARQAITERAPAAVICEVLTNPLARVVEVDIIAQIARRAGASLIVDNTFATPFLLRPLELGADLIVHSATKFLNGHGDVLGGVVAGRSALIDKAYATRKLLGSALGAFDAWLALRGLRTLAVRMHHACENARRVAEWLAGQTAIRHVYYPGLPADAGYAAASRLFRAGYYGSLIAFEINGLERAGAFAFMESLRVIRPVTSLGDVYSLILHPASSSHRALSPEQREALGIHEGTLRLSVGIEDAGDLIDDLEQALRAVGVG